MGTRLSKIILVVAMAVPGFLPVTSANASPVASASARCSIQPAASYVMTNSDHTIKIQDNGNPCNAWIRARIRCILINGGYKYNYGRWEHNVGGHSSATSSCTDMTGQPDQAGFQYSPDQVHNKNFVICWIPGWSNSGFCG